MTDSFPFFPLNQSVLLVLLPFPFNPLPTFRPVQWLFTCSILLCHHVIGFQRGFHNLSSKLFLITRELHPSLILLYMLLGHTPKQVPAAVSQDTDDLLCVYGPLRLHGEGRSGV